MRYLLFLLLLISSVTYSQSNVDFRGDSARFYKNGGSMEVVIRNSTKDSTNGILVNTGNGVTSFLKLRVSNDSLFLGNTFISLIGSSGNDSTYINFDLPSGYIIVDGDTTDVNVVQYMNDSLIRNQYLSKETKDAWIHRIRADSSDILNRINIGSVTDSMITRKGQLQILGTSGNFPDGVLSIIRTNTTNPATIQTSSIRGQFSAPTPITNNTIIGRWSMEGSDGTLTSGKATLKESIRIEGEAVGLWSASNFGSKISIDYTPKDSTIRRVGAKLGDTVLLRPTAHFFLTRGASLAITGSTALFQTDGRMQTTKHLIEGNLRSSATSLTIVDSTYYIFTGGSDATWTLPAVGTPGRRIFIKNAGSAVLTVQRAGSDQIFTNTLVNSFALLTGADRVLVDDGVYWQTFSN